MILADDTSARKWLVDAFPSVSRETWNRLEAFNAFLNVEGQRQNLVARSTLGGLYLRHITDSAQLLALAPPQGSWLDLGSGAGFPGLIVALLSDHRVTLVESRRLRIDFLTRSVDLLAIGDRTTIVGAPLERVTPSHFDVVSARAFAPLERLLPLAYPFSSPKTRWLLPKGRSAHTELAAVASSWHGAFRLEPSITDPEARIIVADAVRPVGQGKTT